jgi:nitroimidazol reductase NimA-like FMN-containing flavoprotein (pyridoxamine 5'-phosphate oxidase superfamily)
VKRHRHGLTCLIGCVFAALAVAHPWLHAFEGGSLDLAMMYGVAYLDAVRT